VLTPILVRLRTLVHRRRIAAEIDEELRYHLDRETERNVARGMTDADAADAARRAIGNMTAAAEEAREAWTWPVVEESHQDIAYALRTFRRAPTFVLTVVATIGLGLGLLTTAFTVFNAYVLRPLDVREPHSLYDASWHARGGTWHAFTLPQFERLRANRRVFTESLGYLFRPARIRGAPMMGQVVTGNYFQMLGVPAAVGRTLLPGDSQAGGDDAVVVLSARVWRSTFGADSAIIGRAIRVSDGLCTVVGVAREGFGGLGSVPIDFWMPLSARVAEGAGDGIRVVGRIRSQATTAQTESALLDWLRAETADRDVASRAGDVVLISRATPLPPNREIYTLFAPIAAGFVLVLLIACANVANMMLARGFARQREIGIRLTLGAGRRRLIRQLLTEALVLAIPSGVVGYVVSRASIALGVRTMFATVPPAIADRLRVVPLDADARLVLFMSVIAGLAAAAFGIVPALQATRPNIVRMSRGDFDLPFRPSRLRNGLVIAQVTLSVFLLIGAALLLGSVRHAQRLDPGLHTAGVLQLDVPERVRPRAIARLHADPRVRELASAVSGPLDGAFSLIAVRTAGGAIEYANVNIVSAEYFGTVGLPLVRGRTFTVDEATTRAPVTLVSVSAARRLWPGRDPIGQELTHAGSTASDQMLGRYHSARVIGVVGDATPGTITRPTTLPTAYYPQPVDARDSRVLMRVAGPSEELRPAMARTLAAVDSSAVEEMHSLGASLALQVYPFRVAYWLAAAIGAVALLLTLTGVYGVLSYVVAQRRREFGIRMALGAASHTVVALVVRQSLRLSLVGAVIGLTLALGLARVIGSVLLVSDLFDARAYAGGAAVVVVACLVAACVPSRRAGVADPAETLRADS
jgi:predicted permease